MIVHGVLSLDVGGLERIVVELAKYAVNQGKIVAVVCVERPGVLAGELEAAGVKVYSLNKPPVRDASFIDAAEKLLREFQPRVVHTHQIGAAWYLAHAAKRLGVRVVHTEHGNPFARADSWSELLKLRILMKRTAKSIDAFAVVSPEIAEAVSRWWTVPAKKVLVVPNGISIRPSTIACEKLRASLKIPAEAFVIGTVGRMNEVKRQDILLRAAAKLTGAWVLLVGDGPERDALVRLADELGLRDRAVFAGYQEQPANYLAAMDVFALTSRSEGFPVSLLEAWAAKRPVVVSAVGGLTAIVKHSVNGLLVPSGDVAAFTAEFAKLQADSQLCRSLGTAGHREMLEHYTIDRMAERYETLYR